MDLTRFCGAADPEQGTNCLRKPGHTDHHESLSIRWNETAPDAAATAVEGAHQINQEKEETMSEQVTAEHPLLATLEGMIRPALPRWIGDVEIDPSEVDVATQHAPFIAALHSGDVRVDVSGALDGKAVTVDHGLNIFLYSSGDPVEVDNDGDAAATLVNLARDALRAATVILGSNRPETVVGQLRGLIEELEGWAR